MHQKYLCIYFGNLFTETENLKNQSKRAIYSKEAKNSHERLENINETKENVKNS